MKLIAATKEKNQESIDNLTLALVTNKKIRRVLILYKLIPAKEKYQ